MDEITYEKVVFHLMETLPELREAYAALLEDWPTQQPGPHIVYDLYIDYLVKLSAEGDDPSAREGLERAFELLERLSRSKGFEVRCLVETGIFEALIDMKEVLRKVSSYMGPATRVQMRQFADKLGYDARVLEDLGSL